MKPLSKQWVIADPIPTEEQSRLPDLHPVLLQLLWNRGVRDEQAIERFLYPDWERDTYDHWEFTQMKDATRRAWEALQQNETIVVHGDYDADGVCGTALLVTTLRELGNAKNIKTYIPHREKEGYGLSVATVEHLQGEHKPGLIITVDCGISNNEAIAKARELGIDVIVCDHHELPKEMPNAIIVHPKAPGESYLNKDLCGTAVAFKFASALFDYARTQGAPVVEGREKWLLDLVAIATVTDVMNISGENRVLEKFGLVVLNKTRRVGIKELLRTIGGKQQELTTMSIGFQIGPRLNAAGRMKHANDALKLLIETNAADAAVWANHLEETNRERQGVSRNMYKQARAQITHDPKDELLVVHDPSWSPGIVGLVAGKLLSEFHLPVFAVGSHEGKFVGSGRSPSGFNITTLMHKAAEHLDGFGGHPEACGFSTTGDERFAQAIEVMKQHAAVELKELGLKPSIQIDAALPLDQINWELFGALELLRPFGRANEEPVFVTRNVTVLAAKPVGKEEKHLKLTVDVQGGKMGVIGFGFGHHIEELSPGSVVDLVYHLNKNVWNGKRELQLQLIDLKLSN